MAAALVVGLVAAACSVEETLSLPDCFSGGTGLIVAQSVPTADLVPCTTGLPDGWAVDSVTINQDGTLVRLDSDRAGSGAARLEYAAQCDLEEAISVPSDQEGAERFELIRQIESGFKASRFYVFPGGCVWWEFDFDQGVSSALSIELGDRLVLMTREALNDNIREDFIDEEL